MIAEYRGGTSFSLSSNFKSYQGLQPVSGINKKKVLSRVMRKYNSVTYEVGKAKAEQAVACSA